MDNTKLKAYKKAYYQRNKEYFNAYGKKYTASHKLYRRIYSREYSLNRKKEVLTYYGSNKLACVICGEARIACLSLDHINNDGAEERKKLNLVGGNNFYIWIQKQNYPEGYQTLCMNCQYIKRDAFYAHKIYMEMEKYGE